jgi:hypothetical protein
MSSRDVNEKEYKHTVHFLDDRTDYKMPGYDGLVGKDKYMVTVAKTDLSIKKHGNYEKLLTGILAAHGIRRTDVSKVRLDYKIETRPNELIRITWGTAVDEIITASNTIFVFKVVEWTNKKQKRPQDKELPSKMIEKKSISSSESEHSAANVDPAFVTDKKLSLSSPSETDTKALF